MTEPPLLGRLIGADEPVFRDAIHIAVAPVIASEDLMPGQHVGLDASPYHAWTRAKVKVGIVDPFLTEPVQKGERFWLCLYPQTVTSLRHVWSHPAFRAVVPAKTEEA